MTTPDPETPVAYVIVVRNPDYDNDYTVVGAHVATIDIDMGRADLSNEDELLDWLDSHLTDADQCPPDVRQKYVEIIAGSLSDGTIFDLHHTLEDEDEDPEKRAHVKDILTKLDRLPTDAEEATTT